MIGIISFYYFYRSKVFIARPILSEVSLSTVWSYFHCFEEQSVYLVSFLRFRLTFWTFISVLDILIYILQLKSFYLYCELQFTIGVQLHASICFDWHFLLLIYYLVIYLDFFDKNLMELLYFYYPNLVYNAGYYWLETEIKILFKRSYCNFLQLFLYCSLEKNCPYL